MQRHYDVELARAVSSVTGWNLTSHLRNAGMASILVLTGDTTPEAIGLDLNSSGEGEGNVSGVMASPALASRPLTLFYHRSGVLECKK